MPERESGKVRVVLLDDDDRFRTRLIERLGFFDEIDIVAEARSAHDLLRDVSALDPAPDVALLDIELPVRSGIEVAGELTRRYPELDVLMLTVFEDADHVFDAVRAGASGYLLKDAEAKDIVEGILDLRAGGAPLSRTVARRILRSVRESPREDVPTPVEATRRDPKPGSPDAGSTPSLSRRETELLERIVAGETEADIARHLFISPHTVRTHVKNIYKKLQVHSRAAAVRVTIERGLLEGGS